MNHMDESDRPGAIPSSARNEIPIPPPVAVTESLLNALPKTDLHCHLDGSMRLQTIIELAKEQGVKLPAETTEGLASAIHMGQICRDLNDYLIAFDVTCSVLQTEESLCRAAYELAMDAAAENVRYLEERYSPVLHQKKGLKLTQIVESVLEGLRLAEKEANIRCGVIICGLRHMNPATSLRLAELAVAYKNQGVIGYDLAGAEYDFPAKDHKDAFQLILNNNVNCTCHAGEAYGPKSIAQALHMVGAHRIGHGTHLLEDGDLLNYVNDHRIPLEVCPSSNVQTRAVETLESHPIRFYFDYGLRITVNTDNRLITDTTVTKELLLLHKKLGFTLEDIIAMIISGFKSAFLPYKDKVTVLHAALKEIDDVLDRFNQQHLSNDLKHQRNAD